jgi:hypothetical protein
MTTKCNNPFLETDGYCTKCGQNHFQLAKQERKAKKAAEKKAAKVASRVRQQQDILATIKSHPLYGPAYEMATRIMADYKLNVPVVFRNRKSSACDTNLDTGKSVIVLGYQNISYFAEHGYTEYATLQHILKGRRPTGSEAAKYVAIHEAAHALVIDIDGYVKGDAHGRSFASTYQQLLETYLSA